MVASKQKAPKKSKRKAPKTTKDNIIKKSKPKSKTKKAKTGVKKKSKLRQTKLSFEPPTVTPLRPPRGGGRMEYETFSEGSVTFAGSSRQSDASAREHPHRSQFDHSSRSSIPPGCCIVNLQDDMNDTERTSTSTPKEETEAPRLPTMSLSPHLPVSSESDKPTNRRKREYQSTLEELFPIQQPSSTKKKKRVVDTESDSDNLDQIQLESAQESSDFESEAQKSDAEDQESEGEEQESHAKGEISDADSDDDIVGPSTRRRRLLVSSPPRTPSPRHPSGEDPHTDEELSQELRDITSSARKSHVAQRMRSTKSRNKLKSQFQKNLESLRKKKQGLESDSESQDQSESEGDTEDKRGLYDSTSEVDSVASDDFVVDDDEKLTLEEIMQIPPEFTSVSYQGPQLNFKVVVQGEVYALLHPDYQGLDYTNNARPVDPYFRIAYKSLERQVTGITDSAISSSSWRPWFIRTLKQRPEFESERVPGDIAICDACNVGKRHATYIVRLSGPKYDPRTLEILAPQNESVCYYDNDNRAFLKRSEVTKEDLKEGNVIKVKLDREWALGTFCHERAEIAHYFYHWRYYLREQVKDALDYINCLSQAKKDQIRRLRSEQRNRALDEVMDLLDQKRHIARMYKAYRERIKHARDFLTDGGIG